MDTLYTPTYIFKYIAPYIQHQHSTPSDVYALFILSKSEKTISFLFFWKLKGWKTHVAYTIFVLKRFYIPHYNGCKKGKSKMRKKKRKIVYMYRHIY